MSKKIIIFAFIILNSQFSILNSYAANDVWKDGDFLLWSYGKPYISPSDFCFALRYENEKIGNPICTYAGDWERDSTTALYAKWLSVNLDARISPTDLRPRNQHVVERMRSLKDKILLYSTIRNDSVWVLRFDETSLDPSKISVFSIKEDSAQTAKKIASSWFGGTPQRRLSDEERAAKEMEPDESYAEQPKHDFWFGLGAGFSRAKVPLTPSSWYKRTLESKVKDYKNPSKNFSKDSTKVPSSIWNYLEDSSPIYSAYIGGSLYDFIGAELELRRSEHKVKIDKENEIYDYLSDWNYSRYELMLALEFMTAFKPHKAIEIKPYASASVVYSFYLENIKEENSCEFYECRNRFKLENVYSGVALTLGLRTAFFTNYALNLRTGIINRGAATSNHDIIGTSTTDAFISAALEYHIRWIF